MFLFTLEMKNILCQCVFTVTFAQVPADDANLEEQHEPGGGVFNQEL